MKTSRILADTARHFPLTTFYSTFPVNVAIFNSPIALVI